MPREHEQAIFDRRIGSYTRTRTEGQVTYSCQRCGREETYEQLPGRTRKYCRICLPTVEAEQSAARYRRRKERRQHGQADTDWAPQKGCATQHLREAAPTMGNERLGGKQENP